jgi:hypothetical protein
VIEQRLDPAADVEAAVASERVISPSLGGRTVFDEAPGPPRTPSGARVQLELFADEI